MKKVLFLSFIFFLMLALAGFNPVKADDVAVITPYIDTPTISQSDIDTYNTTVFMMEYLRNGGTIDLANTSSDFSIGDFFSDFDDFIVDVLGKAVQVINPFQEEFQWGNGYPLKPATPSIIDFMGRLPFYALGGTGGDEPTPTPPVEYQSYIDTINGIFPACFFWGGSTLSFPNTTSYTNATLNGQSQSYSYCSSSYGIVTGNTQTSSMYICPITDVYIVSTSENQYQFTTRFTATCWGQLDPSKWGSPIYCYTGEISGSTITPSGRNANSEFTGYYKNLTYSGTLTQCLQYLTNYCRNINIYVDGVPWSIVGSSQSYNIEISTGTVTPQGERVRWMYDKEIYVDIDKILERLEDIIDAIKNTPNTPTIIKYTDFDDLIVDVDGQPALAVKVVTPDNNIDEEYLSKYGPLIPVFVPLFTPVIDDSDILLIAETPMSAIPSDLLEVFGYIFIGMLFVCFIHRLLE